MEAPRPSPPPSPTSPRPSWLAWLPLLVLVLFLGQLLRGREERPPPIPYSRLITELERGNLAKVEIIADQGLLRGEFRAPTVVEGKTVTRFSTVLPFSDPAPLVAKLEAKAIPIMAERGTGSWTTLLVSLLPWVLIIGFWALLLRRMSGTIQGASAFGQVGARALTGDRPKVTFADVAGADEAKAELTEIIEFLKDPGRFQRLGGRMPKGVLLVGPPGTGKTLLARAVAGEAQVPFFSISGSDFVEMFVGVGAARVRDLFAAGKRSAPSIVFIDELDAVGRLRGAGLGGGHDEREQTLNQLLVELDGFKPNDGVVLLSATNRPDVLDPALLRPGRFDRQVVVDLPDVRGRELILQVHARKVPLAPDVDLGKVARGTPGLSGADLANLVNEASILAARQAKTAVDMDDFEAAKDKVMLGIERRSLVLSESERRLTAYHEAGHALISLLVPGLDPLNKVTIVPRGRALGLTHSLPEEDRHSYPREYLEARLVAAYGGRVAEELVFGSARVTTGAAQDFDQATQLARRMVTEFGMSDVVGPMGLADQPTTVFLGRELAHRRELSDRMADVVDAEVRRLVTTAYQRAKEVLSDHLNELHAVAAALLEHETLTRDEVLAHLHPAPPARAPSRPQSRLAEPPSGLPDPSLTGVLLGPPARH